MDENDLYIDADMSKINSMSESDIIRLAQKIVDEGINEKLEAKIEDGKRLVKSLRTERKQLQRSTDALKSIPNSNPEVFAAIEATLGIDKIVKSFLDNKPTTADNKKPAVTENKKPVTKNEEDTNMKSTGTGIAGEGPVDTGSKGPTASHHEEDINMDAVSSDTDTDSTKTL